MTPNKSFVGMVHVQTASRNSASTLEKAAANALVSNAHVCSQTMHSSTGHAVYRQPRSWPAMYRCILRNNVVPCCIDL